MVFEDVEYKDQSTIKIYDSKKETIKQIRISQELYDEIIKYKIEMTTTKNIIHRQETYKEIKFTMDILCLMILKDQ